MIIDNLLLNALGRMNIYLRGTICADLQKIVFWFSYAGIRMLSSLLVFTLHMQYSVQYIVVL